MRYLVILPLLAGCAMTDDGLGQRPVIASYQSIKAPRDVADCLSRTVTLRPIEPSGDGYITLRKNPYGSPMSRYDVVRVDAGSRVDVRSNASFAAGLDKVSACL